MSAHCTHTPVQVLGRQKLFSSLSVEERARLAERSLCRAVARGAALFREGEECRGLYLVLEGTAEVYRASASGQEQIIHTLTSGESLGEVSLFDGGAYLASARMASAGRVLFLPLAEVYALYRTHPEVARVAVEEMGRRIRSLVALVEQLALQDVPTRVAAALCEYASSAEAAPDGALRFRLPRTQEQLAAELGTTRESIARNFARLRREGVIAQRGAKLEILDPTRLRERAGRWSATRTPAARAVGTLERIHA